MRGCYTRNKKDFCLRNKTFMITLKEKPGELFKVNAWLREDSLKLNSKWTGKVVRGDMPPVYCGSIASVRSPTPACPYRVPASWPTSLHCSLFLVQAFKHRLASVSRLLTVLAGAISSLSIEAAEDCFIRLPIGLPLQPARVNSYPVLSLTREFTARLELGICACRPCNRRGPSASQSQWSETASEGVPSSSVLPWDSLVRAGRFVVSIVQFLERLSWQQSSSDRCQMASDSFVNLREAECRIARSRDTRTTVDTIRSCAARVGGSFARFGCADGVVRTRLLIDSSQ